MNWGLLLFPAVGGYWFITHFNGTRYQVSRQSGYHVLFQSAAYGVVLYFVADWAVGLGMLKWLIQFLDKHSPDLFKTESALSILIALVSPPILNLFYGSMRGVRKAARYAGEDVELLILDSLRNGALVEVTLENRKVYIGMAVNSGVGKGPDADAAIFPYFSGHRDEKTLELQIDTSYEPIISQHVSRQADGFFDLEEQIERFRVVIPISRVVSARPFEQEVFDDFVAANERLHPGLRISGSATPTEWGVMPTQNWQGASGRNYTYEVYEIPITPIAAPANYIFARWANNAWYALYIGETQNLADRLQNHEQWPCAQRNGVTHIHVHRGSADRSIRQTEERDLIARWNPICNG